MIMVAYMGQSDAFYFSRTANVDLKLVKKLFLADPMYS